MKETEIYVELLEGIEPPVFAPIPAMFLGQRFYKILEHNQEDYDTLRFNTGIYVICLMTQFEIGQELVPVAYSEISQEAVECILANSKK